MQEKSQKISLEGRPFVYKFQISAELQKDIELWNAMDGFKNEVRKALLKELEKREASNFSCSAGKIAEQQLGQ